MKGREVEVKKKKRKKKRYENDIYLKVKFENVIFSVLKSRIFDVIG